MVDVGTGLPSGVWWMLVLVHNFFVLSLSLVPMDLDVKMKAVMLGACFLIVSVLSY